MTLPTRYWVSEKWDRGPSSGRKAGVWAPKVGEKGKFRAQNQEESGRKVAFLGPKNLDGSVIFVTFISLLNMSSISLVKVEPRVVMVSTTSARISAELAALIECLE